MVRATDHRSRLARAELRARTPQFEQPQYNMFHRNRVEEEYHPLYAQPYSMGTTIWSPLASGILTGKYNDAIPEGSRMTQKGYEWLSGLLAQHHANGNIEKVRALTDYATTHLDCSMTQLALAWCIKNKHVSTVLLGATHPDQLAENLDALAAVARLTDEHMANIEAILGNAPKDIWGSAVECEGSTPSSSDVVLVYCVFAPLSAASAARTEELSKWSARFCRTYSW